MRILLLSPRGQLGGAERTMVSLAHRLPERGMDCYAVLLEAGPLREALSTVGCPVALVPADRIRRARRVRGTVHEIADVTRDVGADVVISCHPRGHIFGGRAAAAADRAAILWQHGIPSRSPLDIRASFVHTAAIVCVSETSARAQRRLSRRAPISVIPPGVDLAAVRSASGAGRAIRTSLGWDDKLIVGIVGRLQEWKGQRTFLAAAARLAGRCRGVRFLVVGGAILGTEGTYEQELHALAVELGLDARVHFAGQQDDVAPWFDAMDIVVHASGLEPFGRVIVEAMALGKPVVATDAGGPTEIVRHEETGLLVRAGDDAAFANAIERLITDRELAERLGAAAAANVEAFTDHAMADGFVGVLRSIGTDAGRGR